MADPIELLESVWQQRLDLTIADSNDVALMRQFYPELNVAFELGQPQPLAWVFPPHTDDSLYVAAVLFFNRLRTSGELDQLIERHYGHVDRFDYVGTRTLFSHIKHRLPKYAELFKEAAQRHGLDWRLLGAIGYQESHWDPKATSPTGVRGIMMLTRDTAKQVGIENRLDPEQSILGGAEYFAGIRSRIPERIDEPDRTWFALAAYNVGFGHLEDARKLAQNEGADPDRWLDA